VKSRAVTGAIMIALAGAASMPASAEPVDIDAELARVREEIARQEAELSKYEGGLVPAMIRLNIEILRNTASFLDQRRLMKRFASDEKPGGWFPFLGGKSSVESAPVAEQPLKKVRRYLVCDDFFPGFMVEVDLERSTVVFADDGNGAPISGPLDITPVVIRFEQKREDEKTVFVVNRVTLGFVTSRHKLDGTLIEENASSGFCSVVSKNAISDTGQVFVVCREADVLKNTLRARGKSVVLLIENEKNEVSDESETAKFQRGFPVSHWKTSDDSENYLDFVAGRLYRVDSTFHCEEAKPKL